MGSVQKESGVIPVWIIYAVWYMGSVSLVLGLLMSIHFNDWFASGIFFAMGVLHTTHFIDTHRKIQRALKR